MALPNVSYKRMRREFDKIIGVHSKPCTLIKYNDSYSGDFFDVKGDKEVVKHTIQLSIQGESDEVRRLLQGIEPVPHKLACYVGYMPDVTIEPTDQILIDDRYYVIDNLSYGIKSGQTVFYNFDIKYATHKNP